MPKRRLTRLGIALLAAGLVAAATASALTVQHRGLRMTVLSQIIPYKLPRTGTAPVAAFVSGHLEAARGGIPPQLRRLTIYVNRHGRLLPGGLPTCRVSSVQPATTERALSRCKDALVGSGRFWAHIVLPDQGAYPTQGRLLVFNGRRGREPLLLAHIFTNDPFNSSFVIPFSLDRVSRGAFGTRLRASLPQALGNWGYLDRIKLTLRRKYRRNGQLLSYFNAGCPAPKGLRRAVFPLAQVDFSFEGIKPLRATIVKTCGVRE